MRRINLFNRISSLLPWGNDDVSWSGNGHFQRRIFNSAYFSAEKAEISPFLWRLLQNIPYNAFMRSLFVYAYVAYPFQKFRYGRGRYGKAEGIYI